MTDASRALLLEELFLAGCTEVVASLYTHLEYQEAICEECRTHTPRQTDHRCYWEERRELVKEQMECAIYTLQRKPWQVFREMSKIVQWEHPKYDPITGADILEFFEKRVTSLQPLEAVCSREAWKNRIVNATMKRQGYHTQDSEGQWYMDKMDGTPSEPVTLITPLERLGTPPLSFSQEMTRDAPY